MRRWQKIFLSLAVLVALIALAGVIVISDRGDGDPAAPRPSRTAEATGSASTPVPRDAVTREAAVAEAVAATPPDQQLEASSAAPSTTEEPTGADAASATSSDPRSAPPRSVDRGDERRPLEPTSAQETLTRRPPESADEGESGSATTFVAQAGPASGTLQAADPTPAAAESDEPTETRRRGAAEPVAPPSGPAPPPDRAVSDDAPPPLPTRVGMIPTAVEVSVGDRVSVQIAIEAGDNVGHVPFHVRFNPRVLQFEAGDEGSFLRSDGAPTAFFAAPTSDGATIVVGLSRLGQPAGVSGSGDLCTLHFIVVGPGDAGLAFARAKVKDPANRALPALFASAQLLAH